MQGGSRTEEITDGILKREQATGIGQLKLALAVSVPTGRMPFQRHGHKHDVGLLVDVLRNSDTRGGNRGSVFLPLSEEELF